MPNKGGFSPVRDRRSSRFNSGALAIGSATVTVNGSHWPATYAWGGGRAHVMQMSGSACTSRIACPYRPGAPRSRWQIVKWRKPTLLNCLSGLQRLRLLSTVSNARPRATPRSDT